MQAMQAREAGLGDIQGVDFDQEVSLEGSANDVLSANRGYQNFLSQLNLISVEPQSLFSEILS
jgi:hypothetical protein